MLYVSVLAGGEMKLCRWVQVGVVSASILLSSCASPRQQPERYLFIYDAVPVSPSRFVVCNQVSCDETASVHLTGNNWLDIQRLFEPPAADSESERTQISRAIARMEQLVGDQVVTSTHGQVPGSYPSNQTASGTISGDFPLPWK